MGMRFEEAITKAVKDGVIAGAAVAAVGKNGTYGAFCLTDSQTQCSSSSSWSNTDERQGPCGTQELLGRQAPAMQVRQCSWTQPCGSLLAQR